MKEQKIIKLKGMMLNMEPARNHQADKVVAFMNQEKGVTVKIYEDYVLVSTKKGDYTLPKSKAIINMYCGTARGIKVHFTAKKIVAKLIYWA